MPARHQSAQMAGRSANAMAHPGIEAPRDRLGRPPYPEPARRGHQMESHGPTIAFGEVVEDDAAPGAFACRYGAAAVEQLRIPDEDIALPGLEQFAFKSAFTQLRLNVA